MLEILFKNIIEIFFGKFYIANSLKTLNSWTIFFTPALWIWQNQKIKKIEKQYTKQPLKNTDTIYILSVTENYKFSYQQSKKIISIYILLLVTIVCGCDNILNFN